MTQGVERLWLTRLIFASLRTPQHRAGIRYLPAICQCLSSFGDATENGTFCSCCCRSFNMAKECMAARCITMLKFFVHDDKSHDLPTGCMHTELGVAAAFSRSSPIYTTQYAQVDTASIVQVSVRYKQESLPRTPQRRKTDTSPPPQHTPHRHHPSERQPASWHATSLS